MVLLPADSLQHSGQVQQFGRVRFLAVLSDALQAFATAFRMCWF
jgi:hypothetical protein